MTEQERDQLLVTMARQVNFVAGKEGYWNLTTGGSIWSTMPGMPGTAHKEWLNGLQEDLFPPKVEERT